MSVYICEGCGTSYPESGTPPVKCRVCNEERAHVPGGVQQWTRLADMQTRYRNVWKQLEENIFEISTTPRFSIGQRALFMGFYAGTAEISGMSRDVMPRIILNNEEQSYSL